MLRFRLRFFIPFLLAAAVLAAFVSPALVFVVFGGFLAVWFLVRNLEFGVLLLIFFFPYRGLVIDFNAFSALREIYYLRNINAPLIDLYGLLLFGAWLIHILLSQRGKIFHSPLIILQYLPHWRSYLFFWLSGLVSLLRAPAIYLGTALKYFVRPFTFFYLIFFAAPVSIFTRSTFHDSRFTLLHRALTVFYWTGLLSAFNGFLGLLFGSYTDFPRATPFGFFGINPLGPNHNLLAETLIATAPAGLILSSQSRWIKYGMWFQWAIALLTFARTAWIAVVAQVVIYLWLTQRGKIKSFLRRNLPVLTLVGLFLIILFATTFTEAVRSSTLSRLEQGQIAWFYFLRSPWIGQGVGTFVPILTQTRAFLLEYGDPLEAHGVLIKIIAEQGLLGLITFVIFVGAILRKIYKTYQLQSVDKNYIVVALLIASGALIYQVFNTNYYTVKLWIPMALALVISKVYYENSNRDSKMVS